jgi:tRNA pseudouridine38-40 synthase
MTSRYKLLIAYDGTDFAGWQVQSNALAIQPLIQKALSTVLRHEIDLTGSGRTDAGVHAHGQVAHFDSSVTINPPLLRSSLNALLPETIRILEITPVDTSFHARYSATSKIYHYHLHLSPITDPFTRNFSLRVVGLNLDRLRQGSKQFLGTHDFTSFANLKDAPLLNATRTILRLDVIDTPQTARLEFEGTGFLYKMVRNITGTLLAIGTGKLPPEEVGRILDAKDRTKAPAAAPAKGLFLAEVRY